MNAVDEEFKKNIESDGWRMLHVRKELAPKSHPFSQFNTGNLDTMKLIDQEYLKMWFKSHYGSNLMNLVVIGKECPEKLADMVEKSFGPIKNCNSDFVKPQNNLFSSLSGKTVWVESIKNLKEVVVTWEIPSDLCNDLISKPCSILGHAMGHEGNDSLLSFLKKP